jgi:hypothetical protein
VKQPKASDITNISFSLQRRVENGGTLGKKPARVTWDLGHVLFHPLLPSSPTDDTKYSNCAYAYTKKSSPRQIKCTPAGSVRVSFLFSEQHLCLWVRAGGLLQSDRVETEEHSTSLQDPRQQNGTTIFVVENTSCCLF